MSKEMHKILAYTGLLNSILFFVFLLNINNGLGAFAGLIMAYIFCFQIALITNELANKSEERNVNNNKN